MSKEIISKRMKYFDSSAIKTALSLSSSHDLIDLSIGFPEDDTPDEIKKQAIEAINQNITRYTAANGIKELRNAVSDKLREQNNIHAHPDQISILPGVTTGIMLVYLAILDKDDEIIIPDPYFPPYKDLAIMLGAKPVFIETAPTFQLTAEMVENSITPKTKAILINSPNNPSGAVYPEGELRKIAEVANAHNIIIISDEIYEHFSYTENHFSIGSVYPNTITMNGFSKAYAMTGWRLGYMAGPEEIIDTINSLIQYIVFSSHSVSQMAALKALELDPQKMIKKYEEKRKYIIDELSGYYKIHGAQGAYYFFPQVPKQYKDDNDFCQKAAEQKLMILPGSVFSQHHNHFRISYGAPMEEIKKGVAILKKLA